MLKIAFTGHRPDKVGGYDENNPTATYIKSRLKNSIDDFVSRGECAFMAGGALGIDTWSAEEVIAAKSKLIIARPFPSQDKVWPNESKIRFNDICSKASEIIDVSSDPYAAWKMQKRNEFMVDWADYIIAVWDGSAGGTGNCVNYAKKKNKHIIIIDPKAQII